MEKKQNIFLIGFMGTGKSTIARELQKKLGCACVEMDQRIVKEQGMPIAAIFEKYGELHFRNLETELLKKIGDEDGAVVSCGGGVVLRDENIERMKRSGCVVLLTAQPETIFERVRHSKERPVLNGNMNVEYIGGLMEKRKERYEAAADITIATDNKSAAKICDEITERLQERNKEGVKEEK